jgi:hypothetical protein
MAKLAIVALGALAFFKVSAILGWKLTLFVYAGIAVWLLLG